MESKRFSIITGFLLLVSSNLSFGAHYVAKFSSKAPVVAVLSKWVGVLAKEELALSPSIPVIRKAVLGGTIPNGYEDVAMATYLAMQVKAFEKRATPWLFDKSSAVPEGVKRITGDEYEDIQKMIKVVVGGPDLNVFAMPMGNAEGFSDSENFIIYNPMNLSYNHSLASARALFEQNIMHESVHVAHRDALIWSTLALLNNLDELKGRDAADIYAYLSGLKKVESEEINLLSVKYTAFCEKRADIISMLRSSNPVFNLLNGRYSSGDNAAWPYCHLTSSYWEKLIEDVSDSGVKDRDYGVIAEELDRGGLHDFLGEYESCM